MTDKFKKNINRQIEFNQGKNLFSTENQLMFINDTINAINNIDEIDNVLEEVIIDYTVDKVLQEFYRVNQYFSFSDQQKLDLRKIYSDLFLVIRAKDIPVTEISNLHYEKLKIWMTQTNPFSQDLYSKKEKIIKPVTCAEYSAELQIEILHLDISTITQPVLDIGCGKNATLVKYLRKRGIETYGIERVSNNLSYVINGNWLEYDYGKQKWGTIISNLGFSNHFNHHHLRTDGDYIEYAKKYMGILDSLKVSGSFHYAPDLGFIEKYLDPAKFQVIRQNIDNCDFQTSIVRRIL